MVVTAKRGTIDTPYASPCTNICMAICIKLNGGKVSMNSSPQLYTKLSITPLDRAAMHNILEPCNLVLMQARFECDLLIFAHKLRNPSKMACSSRALMPASFTHTVHQEKPFLICLWVITSPLLCACICIKYILWRWWSNWCCYRGEIPLDPKEIHSS